MRFFSRYFFITLIIISISLFSSCGSKYIGWAVIYIEDSENSIRAGSIYPVLQESEIRDVYTLESSVNKAGLDVDRWKASFHKKEAEAKEFADKYKRWADFYAVTMLNGLSIREEPDSESERVYKLRESQTVKIIGRVDKVVNIANHDGYWYSVLTEDGTSGYCFDKNLRIYNARESGAESANVIDTELLQTFLSREFRPESFKDMIRDNMIDLSQFKPTRGIFAHPEENKVVLNLKDIQKIFDYTAISQNSNGRFIFEGSSLQVEVRGENKIAVYYSHNNREYAEVMVYISNMEELIESELERRELLFERLEALGSVSSTAYGRITFEEDRTFKWRSYKRLIPNVIPENAGETGKLKLKYFPGLSLRNSYDGVLSFSFDDLPGGGLINFLFELSDLGIKLVYVPSGDINKGIVEQESSSPLVIFMSGAGE